jgi:hypothetical protein
MYHSQKTKRNALLEEQQLRELLVVYVYDNFGTHTVLLRPIVHGV